MFELFKIEKTKRLFSQQYLGKLIDVVKPHIDCCDNDDAVPLQTINLEILEERKLCIPFKKWKTIQSSKHPVVQNVFWHICSTDEIAHHELREVINEVNTNLKAQGNELECFLEHSTENGKGLFYLYSLQVDDRKFFNASVLILNKDFDLLGFDENGNCIHK
jgi:hypothetical protein